MPDEPFIRTDDPRRGILLMVTAHLFFSVMFAMTKVLTDRFPLVEVAFFRNLFGLIPVLIMVAAGGGRRLLRTRRLSGHVWRASIGLTSMVLQFQSYHLMPLADAVAYSFAAPLFVTGLSVPLLGERVGVWRWSAVAVGFVGVLVMAQPTAAIINPGAPVAVASAFAYALAMIAIRQLSRTEAPLTTIVYFTAIATLISGALLPFFWVTPDLRSLALMLAMGVTGGTGQYFLTRAWSLGEAAVIGPFGYSALLWSAGLGWIYWGDVPTLEVLGGAAIVVASGLVILYRERPKPSGP